MYYSPTCPLRRSSNLIRTRRKTNRFIEPSFLVDLSACAYNLQNCWQSRGSRQSTPFRKAKVRHPTHQPNIPANLLLLSFSNLLDFTQPAQTAEVKDPMELHAQHQDEGEQSLQKALPEHEGQQGFPPNLLLLRISKGQGDWCADL